MGLRWADLLAKAKLPGSLLQPRYSSSHPRLSGGRRSKRSCSSIAKPSEPSSWKPVTLSSPLLLTIAALTLSFIAVLEYLSQKSHSNGGVAFAKSQFPTAISFGYLYLPTIIAVFYSMLWNWIDLDVKRLEPWFQLSRPQGADMADSLLLHYPFDFVAFASWKALRRR